MAILVTGGAGFIGSAVVRALNLRGCEDIVVADLLGCGDKWRNLRALRFRDYLEGDDLRARLAARADCLGAVDTVIHLGANSSTAERDARSLVHGNFEATKELCQWALGRGARFVYASSAATYGDGSAGMSDADDAAALARLRPLNAYGWSKQLFDCWARRSGALDHCAGLKYFNVFGPNEEHKGDMRSVVHKAFEQVRSCGRLTLFRSHRPDYRDGEQRRDFYFVKDAAAATAYLALDARGAAGLYNLGSGRAHTWLELAAAVFSALERTPAIDFVDMPEELRPRYQYHTCADTAKLRAAGWTQEPTPLAAAVADTLRHYLARGRRLGEEGDP